MRFAALYSIKEERHIENLPFLVFCLHTPIQTETRSIITLWQEP